MRQFHHVGIPTIRQRPNEIYLEGIKLYITDAGAHPYHVEWVRVAPGCTLPSLLHSAPHVAFMVDDLAAEMQGKRILVPPFVPLPGLRVAFILEDDAAIELMQKI